MCVFVYWFGFFCFVFFCCCSLGVGFFCWLIGWLQFFVEGTLVDKTAFSWCRMHSSFLEINDSVFDEFTRKTKPWDHIRFWGMWCLSTMWLCTKKHDWQSLIRKTSKLERLCQDASQENLPVSEPIIGYKRFILNHNHWKGSQYTYAWCLVLLSQNLCIAKSPF